MKLTQNPAVEAKIKNYDLAVQEKLLELRELILATAKETEGVNELEETLKWGEPSYLAKKGSTIRLDWKAKRPDEYAIFFKCTSQLVPTFKTVYGDLFEYENNRAIWFSLDAKVPKKELKHCIALALTYHKVKHLPLLGA